MGPALNYAVITPVRNEESNLPRLAESMVRQTVKPAVWVIADDGSTDRTAAIAQDLAASHPWIRLVPVVSPEGESYPSRIAGGAVPRAFNRALEAVDEPWDVIVKLDADLSFSADYFEQLMQRFLDNPGLGIAGGHCYSTRGGVLKMEKVPDFHVRGATKAYRKACFEQIGGVEEVLGWDGIDEMKAQMEGWSTRSYADLVVVHHRPNSSRGGVLKGRARGGQCAYFMGYGPAFMFARCIRRMIDPPYVVGGLAMMWGYAAALIGREPRYHDKRFRQYLHAEHRRRLADSLAGLLRLGR